jgi:DNA-directed RNA polymerase specialized sigma24 family protein
MSKNFFASLSDPDTRRAADWQAFHRWVASEHHEQTSDAPNGPAAERPPLDRERLAALLDRLPPVERDVIDLVLRGHSQARIACLLDTSQQAVSSRMATALSRLRWLSGLPKVPRGDVARRELTALLPTRQSRCLTAQLLAAVIETSNVAEAARVVGMSPQTAASRVSRAISHLRDGSPRARNYAEYLDAVCRRRGVMADQRGGGGSYYSPRRAA